jgi:ribose transport system permease protein
LLLILIVLFSVTSADFLKWSNFVTLLREASVVGIMAIGVTFVIITAGIDLSTGGLVAFIGMLCANLIYYAHLPTALVWLIGLIVGLASGYFNGILVTVFRLPEFVATLSTMGIFRGMALVLSIRENGMIVPRVIQDKVYVSLGGSIGDLYFCVIAFILMAVIGHFLLKKTRFGTYTIAVGANRKSAELSGINTGRIRRLVFAFSGFCCTIGAFFLSAKMKTATSQTAIGMEFDVICAVVVGGTSLAGGRGAVIGTVIGTIFMQTLTNGILKFALPTAVQLIVKGAVILLMIVFDSLYNSYMEKRARKKQVEKVLAEGVQA